MNPLKILRKKLAENQLPKAIMDGDFKSIEECLSNGARAIDFTLYREEEFQGKKEKIPVRVFHCPLDLAEYRKSDSSTFILFKKYGFDISKYQTHNQKLKNN